MVKVKYKVPSQAASGAQTFSDNLVGTQITDGSSQLTNTNFAIDRATPEKDSKNFSTVPFSDFLTLDTLKEETNAPKTNTSKTKKDVIKFRPSRKDAGRSLFGSLKERLNISIGRIVSKFPASILADSTTVIKSTNYTAENITHDLVANTTQFDSQQSIFYNPYSIILTQPNSSTLLPSENPIRNFYSAYKNYVIIYQGISYNIIGYTEPTFDNNFILSLEVDGILFSGNTNVNVNFLIKPNDSIVEEFFTNLDDLEELLLNRESNPIYTATFKVPRDNFDESATDLVGLDASWPVSKDGWNPQIVGVEYDQYVQKLFDLSDEIDDYKSNLIVRFLSSPQLFEFDTEDKRAESVFQLYGQSFDSVKKYIDNIAYMRHVSYDGINNIPDMLLKNLSQGLGLNTVNLFDEKSLNDILYTRQDSAYSGVSVGKNLIESEYEFYRRILINLSQLYKSKGTRKTLEFFLKFLGAPEPMIKINEYVYEVTKLPNISTLEDNLYDVINDIKTDFVITGFTESSTGVTYLTGITTSSSTLTRDEYPIDENGLPRKVTSLSNDIFFQKGSGWYDITLDHRSPLILDEENSQLTGRIKYIKTKNAPYTYGEDYFSNFRRLPGLDYGFELTSKIDNLKVNNSINDIESDLLLNRKNLSVYLSPSQAIDYDVWRQSRNLEISLGTMPTQTGFTFAEFVSNVLSNTITNSNTVKYDRNYIKLEDVYSAYVNHTGITSYDFITLNEFVNKMSPYWVQVIEQFVPATTLWTGGNLIENGKFGRSKYRYQKPCQLVEIVEDVYPEMGFMDYINEIIMSPSTGFQQEFGDSGKDGYIRIFPTFEIDGIKYSGVTGDSSTYVVISGNTSNTASSPKHASLYCGSSANTLDVGVIGPDAYDNMYCVNLNALKFLWKEAIQGAVNYINNTYGLTIDNVGKNTEYGNSIGYSTITGTTKVPLLSYEIFVDNMGVEKIRFKSYKYGPHTCTITSFNFLMGSPLYYPYTFEAGTPLPTPSVTMTQTPTMSVTPTQTPTMTITPTMTMSATSAATPSMTMTPTQTPSMTMTPTQTPTMTMTMTPTMTMTMTPSETPTQEPTPSFTPSMTMTPTPYFYWYEITSCTGTTTGYTVPLSGGASLFGRVFWSAGGEYYAMGNYIGTYDTDPGNGDFGSKLSGTVMDVGVTCASLGLTPAPSPNPQRIGYSIQTGTTQQVNDWCTNQVSPSSTSGVTTAYIDYSEAPLIPGQAYTIYKNSSGNDSTLFYTAVNEYRPFVLFGGPNTTVNWKGSISPSSMMQDWTQCSAPPSPSQSAPSTSANYSTLIGARYVCNGPNVPSILQYNIYQNSNIGFTGNQFSNGTGGTQTFDTQTFDSMLTSEPSAVPTLAAPEDAAFCTYGVQVYNRLDTNPCSLTYGQYVAVQTGDNSTCWVLGEIYYDSCENAQFGNYPQQSYIRNSDGVHKYKPYVAPPIYEEYEVGGTIMANDWYRIIDGVAKRVQFSVSGVITGTDLDACVPTGGGGGSGGGGGDID
jgi:hypothetical protein